jgi:hypothetical protein
MDVLNYKFVLEFKTINSLIFNLFRNYNANLYLSRDDTIRGKLCLNIFLLYDLNENSSDEHTKIQPLLNIKCKLIIVYPFY